MDNECDSNHVATGYMKTACILQIDRYMNVRTTTVYILHYIYTVFRKKHPLTFSFISP